MLLKKICLVVSILLCICTILNRNVQSKNYTLNQEADCINLSGGSNSAGATAVG